MRSEVLFFVVAGLAFAVLALIAMHSLLSCANADTGKNVTITIYKGELHFCMIPEDHVECNFTEPLGNRFEIISDFIQFLSNGPTIVMKGDKHN